jgi:hypothetical protein
VPLAVFGIIALADRPALPAMKVPVAPPVTVVLEGCGDAENCAFGSGIEAGQCGGSAELGPPPKVSPFGCRPHHQSPNFDPPPLPDWWTKITPPDLPIERPWEVHAALNRILESPKRRALMRNALYRSGTFAPQITAELAARKLPRALVALPLLESAYSETAISKTGAVGLWQLMPKTARKLGLTVTPSYDERRNPERSTAVALDHLQHLYEHFGNWDLALAAYDRGEPGVDRALGRAGVPDYWSLVDMHALPQETREYVPMLLALTILYENAALFAMDGPRAPPRSIALLDIPVDTPLAIIARAAGTSLLNLRKLSPELVSGDTVPADHVCIPASGLARARAMLPILLAEVDVATSATPDFDWGHDEGQPAPAPEPKMTRPKPPAPNAPPSHEGTRHGEDPHGAEPTESSVTKKKHAPHAKATHHPKNGHQGSVHEKSSTRIDCPRSDETIVSD